jgi:hypothetical protein
MQLDHNTQRKPLGYQLVAACINKTASAAQTLRYLSLSRLRSRVSLKLFQLRKSQFQIFKFGSEQQLAGAAAGASSSSAGS